MAHRLIGTMGLLLTLLGCGGAKLVERPLKGVGVVSAPSAAAPVNGGEAYDEDPARLSFRFAHEYGWASWGSGTAYRQILHVSLLALDAGPEDYARWPSRFSPLYSNLAKQKTEALGSGQLVVSAGRYAQNALDEPAHVYVYSDPAHRLQIAWHVVDKDIAPEAALQLLPQIVASFQLRTDPVGRFAEMRGRAPREAKRAADAVALGREALVKAGFGDAAPGQPVYARGVYAEWMDDPEPRLQLIKPLGLLRWNGSVPPVPQPRNADGARRELSGSVGWRAFEDGAWASNNRDNDYLPLPGIESAFADRQGDEATVLYYFATTLRLEHAGESDIAALGRFFQELPEVERAWQQGTLVSGERSPLPEAP